MAVEELEEIEDEILSAEPLEPEAETVEEGPLYQTARAYKIMHWFNQPKHLISLVDLFINTASDLELFALVKNLTNLPIAYPRGFVREFAIGVIEELKKENPMVLADYGLGLLQQWANASLDLGFMIKEDEIYGLFMFQVDEPEWSGYLQFALRGSDIEKGRAAAAFTKLWHNGYLKHWHDKGFRFIWANAFTPKGKDFINQVGAKEDKHVFFSRQSANKSIRWNGKYHWLMDARWDLKKKFESKENNELSKERD